MLKNARLIIYVSSEGALNPRAVQMEEALLLLSPRQDVMASQMDVRRLLGIILQSLS